MDEMSDEWWSRFETNPTFGGGWTMTDDDGVVTEVYDSELDRLPPYAHARAEVGRLRAERDRLRGAIARHRRRMRNQVIPEMQGPDMELWSVLDAVDGDR